MEDKVKKETPDDGFIGYETTEEIIDLNKVVVKVEELHHCVDIKDDFIVEAESTIDDPLTCKACETTRKYFNGSKTPAGNKPYTPETCHHKQFGGSTLLEKSSHNDYTNKKEKPKKRKRTKNTSTEQYEIYIKYLEDDFNFRTGIVNSIQGDNYVRTKWSALANVLNGMGDGPNLTLEEWKKRFSDWKYATRSKYRRLVQSQKKNYSVSADGNLTPLEKRALAIWKVTMDKPPIPDDYVISKTSTGSLSLDISPTSLPSEEAAQNKYRILLPSPKEVLRASLENSMSPLKERAPTVSNNDTPTEVRSPSSSLTSPPANLPQEVVPVCSHEDPSSTSTDCLSISMKTVTTSSTMTENTLNESTETLQEKEKQTKCLEGILGQLRKQNKLFSTFLKLQFPQYEEEND